VKGHSLSGTEVAAARPLLREVFPDAEIVAGQLFEDGNGGIVQFHDPTRRFGQYATVLVRWANRAYTSPGVWSGHYFDDAFACEVDFEFRCRRGY
jgi:hypothetical protein